MDALKNPFTPNAGAMPPLLVGRDDKVESFRTLLGRLARGRTDQSMMITGLRGVGKTVLLNKFRRIANKAGWAVIEMEVTKHTDAELRAKLASQVRQALLELSPRSRWAAKAHLAARVLRSFTLTIDPDGRFTVGMTSGAEEGRADSGELSVDLPDLLIAVGEAAAEAGRGVVILLDEVQFLSKSQLESAVMAIHKTVQRALPITLVGAGLPQIAELAGEAKSYSERLFTFPRIDMLSKADARTAIAEPIRVEHAYIESDALDLALDVTGRYPYFIQELGYAAWAEADQSPITLADVKTATITFEDKLDGSFFRVRLDRTTTLEQAYLRAMAELGPEPQSAADVAALLKRTSQQCGPTRSQLVDKGLLYTPSHGLAAFTVPHFDRFMKRAIPELVIPTIHPRARKATRHRPQNGRQNP